MSTKRPSVVERGQLLRLNQPEESQEPSSQETKPSRNQEKKAPAPLLKANLLVRRERWALLKRYALDHDKKYYEVLDEALARFLEPQAGR